MQCRIIDSIAPRTVYIAPGAILSMAEFTKHVTFFTSSHKYNVNSNQVALRRLGTGKVAQSRCARLGCAIMASGQSLLIDFL